MHEHLDAFGIINMNGRVYDPLTAQFFSPDPYVQAPGNWLNYNRYAYAYGNPFKYTDPSGELQLGPFYLSLYMGYSPGGGLSFGISAGVGIENAAYAGISVGYNTAGSFTFSGNAGVSGFSVAGGYDTKGGWFGNAGLSAPGISLGLVTINTNMSSIGINYSQNGGWSGNYLGAQISKTGMSFDPSFSGSYGFQTGEYGISETLAFDVRRDGTPIEYSTESAKDFINRNKNLVAEGLADIYADGTLPSKNYHHVDGKVINKTTGKEVFGAAKHKGKKYFFWGEGQSDVYLFKNTFINAETLYLTIGHEFTHVNINYYFGWGKDHSRDEAAAYLWNDRQYQAWGGSANNLYYKAALLYNYQNPYSSVFSPKITTRRPW